MTGPVPHVQACSCMCMTMTFHNIIIGWLTKQNKHRGDILIMRYIVSNMDATIYPTVSKMRS